MRGAVRQKGTASEERGVSWGGADTFPILLDTAKHFAGRQGSGSETSMEDRAFGLRFFNPWNDLKNIRTRQKGTKMVD
jgi:hypothetical protein